MTYQKAKVYNDGSHYIAMPPENFPRPKRRYKPKPKREESPDSPKAKFETAYTESQSLPKRERKKYIKEKLQDVFPNEERAKEFIESNIERKKINAAKRRVRLMRKAEHLDTAEYKAKKIVEAAEQKRAEAEEYSEALQQAEHGEIAHSKSGMRKQIVAVTADNADLKKRLDKVMQETLDIDKENKELKAYKVRAAKALELLAKLERENPSAYNALFESKQKPSTSSSKNWWAK